MLHWVGILVYERKPPGRLFFQGSQPEAKQNALLHPGIHTERRRTSRNSGSTSSTTRCIERIFWTMPTNWREPIMVRQEWMGRASRTSSREGWRSGRTASERNYAIRHINHNQCGG